LGENLTVKTVINEVEVMLNGLKQIEEEIREVRQYHENWLRNVKCRDAMNAPKEEEAEQDALAAQSIAEQEAEEKARAEYEHDGDEKSRHMEDEGHEEYDPGGA